MALTARHKELTNAERWARDPVAYAEERLGLFTWDKFIDIITSVRDNYETAVPTANGIGKTEAAAVVALWWLETHTQAIVLTTGSSWQALQEHLWPRIGKYIERFHIFEGKRVNDMSITITNERYAYARSTKTAEGVQGAHSPHLLQIVEESSGLVDEVGTAIMGNAKGSGSRILWLGNPLNRDGIFYQKSNSRNVNVIHVSAFDHPNVTRGEEVVPGAVTRRDIERDAEAWCTPCEANTPGAAHLWWLEDNAWFLPDPNFTARVLGQFPDLSVDSLYNESLVEQAMTRKQDRARGRIVPLALGCDVARSPVGDETVIFLVNAFGAVGFEAHRGWNTQRTAGRIKNLKDEFTHLSVGIDDTGIGGGVTDALNENAVSVSRILFGNPSADPLRFANLKAEMYWNLKLLLEQREDFVLSNDPILKRQMLAVRRGYDAKGRIVIEPKESYKARTGESPDRLEALLIALHVKDNESNFTFGRSLEQRISYSEMPV